MTSSDSVVRSAESLACSIIIPTRDKLEYLKPCIESIRTTQTQFNYEIVIVDNESKEAETQEYLQALSAEENVRILQWDSAFNFSAINNFAVRNCDAEVICFLNNDIEITDPQWLDKLLPLAQREDVGACGCVLLYPDHSIQHAGIALDRGSIARHIGVGEEENFLRLQGVDHPVSVEAVTAACMFISRELFLKHNGFNEDSLHVSFNDVDLCLRLREKGKPVLLHPEVKLIHHESISRKSDQLSPNRPRALREFDFMQQRWGHILSTHRYKAGLPQAMKDQIDHLPDLDKTVQDATRRLYSDAPLEGQLRDESHDSSSVAAPGSMSLMELRRRYEDLEAHSKRVEEAHRLIESSIFWRLTAPLRSLRNLFRSADQNADEAVETDTNNSATPSDKNNEETTRASGKTKAQYDRDAQHKLEAFLRSAERLEFARQAEPKVSIVLVFYNRAALSFLCLNSILKQVSVAFELIIIDNNSTDETAELLNKLDGPIVKRNSENLGFVTAVNQAAELANGKLLLLLNNDAILEEASVETAVEVIEGSDDIGAVGARIKLLDGSLQEAGSIIWNDGACVGYGRGDNPQAPQYMFQRSVDYCSGAFLMVELAMFREMDCFDEQYAPAYYEESDFCIRLRQLGYRVVYDPRVQITHYEFASTGGISGASELQQAHRQILCDTHPFFLSHQLDNDTNNILFARTANRLPNVLIVDDRVPFPSLGAGYPRCSHILNCLAQMPVNLTFYPLLFPDDDWDEVYALLAPSIEVMLGRGRKGLLDFLKERRGFYQTIMVSRVHNMEIFNQTLNTSQSLLDGVEVIYDAEAVSAPREILQRRLWGESLTDQQARSMVKQELVQAKYADKVVAVSEQESDIYHQHGIKNTTVLGHMLPLEPTPKSFRERNGFLFVGALRDEGSPNVDSLLWFLVNCLPLIEQQIPDFRLYVVGDNTVPSLSSVEKENVIFTGRLDSIDQYYDDCRVFIAPTRFAAGIPHKVHEAASKGLPSVTTSLLARQLAWRSGEQLMSADTPDKFAQHCIQLHSDESLWQQIRDSGLEAIEQDCSPETFQSQLQSLFAIENR